jgi:protein-S-isoprenylcysteine O-methyltransferase Ste14
MTTNEVKHPVPHPTLLPPRGMLIALGLQVPLAALTWPWRPSLGLALAGVSCLLAGSVLNLWAHRLFKRNDVGVCPFSRVPKLVEMGPYRFTRNPMYLGMVLILVAVSLLTASPWNL